MMQSLFRCAALVALVALTPKISAAQIQLQPLAGKQIQLTWQSSSTLSQELLRSTNLLSWSQLLRPYPALVNPAITTNVQSTTNAPKNFYRLQFSALTNTSVPITPGLHTGLKLVSGGLTRNYFLFVPTGHSFTNAPSPLAVILHGGGQSAAAFTDLHPDLFTSAETNGMILALPDATPRDGVLNWNNSELRPYETDIDDVQFILDLVGALKCELNVDNYRVYAGGFSSGGQMVHQLGETTTNVFAALASVGASIASSQNTNTPLVMPPPSLEPFPMLIVNATNDCVRTYYGGVNIEKSLQASVASAANYWVTNNGCTTNNVQYFVTSFATNNGHINRFETDCYPPKAPNNATLVTNLAVLAHFGGCGSNRIVELVSLTDGGHKWPNADDNVGFDANVSVLNFFLLHARSSYATSPWLGQWQIAATSVVTNGGTVNAQLNVQNPGDALVHCGTVKWFNHGEFRWNISPSNPSVTTNDDGDLLFDFGWLPGHSAVTLNASGRINVVIANGQEFSNVVSTVRLIADSGAIVQDTQVTVTVLSQMDYGDAPLPFPTRYADDGARHSINGLRLGALADAESDGTPSASANADDTLGSDDEDGVAFLNPTAAGQMVGLGITVSANGYVDAWCDYNRNGSWLDGNEQIFKRLPLAAGSNYVTVLLPANATPGTTYWRFRISSTGNLAPTGFCAGGEVEDYATTLLPNPNSGGNTNAGAGHVDWGDAPANYPVLAVDYGASHKINDGLCLGAGVDAETNGQPHINALGDGADEDGVAFGALVRSTNVLVMSSAQVNVTGQGYLNAWIDFNGDGDWNDAGEQIATSEFMTFGGNPNNVTFHVPGNAVVGATFARFRFGLNAAVPPTGGAGEGEVEDYKVTITAGP